VLLPGTFVACGSRLSLPADAQAVKFLNVSDLPDHRPETNWADQITPFLWQSVIIS
ncbi:uncharacterized protein METZ01_LOCUS124774, partial [marine metagenome]